ncbi:MAG: hypothetical protein J5713_00660 [Clostridia bacterium]|nr:hypothetical protein [Clostridia bacterium]
MNDGKSIKKNGKLATIFVARVALIAALLTVGKMAFAAVPNVEVVTVLIIVYGATLGLPYALTATLVFCTVEMAIWPPHTWVLLYYLYWPALALVSSLTLRRANLVRTTVFAVIIAVVGSFLFGLLSACVDTLFCVANLSPADLRKYWIAYYLRGVYFDVVHIISNGVIVAVLFAPLVLMVRKIAPDACSIVSGKFKKLSKIGGTYERDAEAQENCEEEIAVFKVE